MSHRIVLGYSGGPASSAALAWLRDHDGDVMAVTIDLGGGRELEETRDRALALGARRAHVLDARDEFARAYLLPALRAGALVSAAGCAAALADCAVARKLVEVAAIERARRVAHSARGAAADRLAACVASLDPDMQVVQVPDTGMAAVPRAPREGAGVRHGERLPEMAADVEVGLAAGVPVAINGIEMALSEMIESLTTIAVQHGIAAEQPALVLLDAARRELERLALPAGLRELGAGLADRYVELIRTGQWFTPMREALDAFFGAAQERVTGAVRVRLSMGQYSISDSAALPPAGVAAGIRS